ncbi:PhzF family phenazine biosynthesis protein [Pseudoalteromonas luteoviolacea]|uniref:Phenazine biosynthesis protein n=1 Tax=Pseudoalteromonas luteoviolacea NCIMB 1942 TaxID=1365253 RepID=A0A167EMU3_9GAMM|nr:PhzF family phenazine biosynthesis protein [Pseudoalteromonas luteoviolacea]KZN50978.1 hypothetical protein N482_06080 [Pseudoalteromonas luteoviolacea NCIMB 1942]
MATEIQMNETFVRQVFCFQHYLGSFAHVRLCTRFSEFTNGENLQSVAASNATAATAFVLPKVSGPHLIRWYSPYGEIQFCGHGTLAAADVLFTALNTPQDTLCFQSVSHLICVEKEASSSYKMLLPQSRLKSSTPLSDVFKIFSDNVCKLEHTEPGDGYFVAQLLNRDNLVTFDFAVDKYCQLTRRALLVTAQDVDQSNTLYFRYFAPQYGVKEDPATGSVAPLLAAFWQLPTNQVFNCYQLSSSGAFYQISRNNDQVCVRANVRTPC